MNHPSLPRASSRSRAVRVAAAATVTATVTAVVTAGLTGIGVGPATAQEQPPTPVVDYTFDDVGPGAATVHNSGSGGAAYDGAVVNGAGLLSGSRGGAGTLTLPGGPQGTAAASMPYVKIPNGVYQGAHGITVATWVKWDGKNATAAAAPWTFILGGDKLARNNYGVFFAPDENGKTAAVANDGQEYKANSAAAIPAGTWTHVALTEDGSTLTLYVNGLATDSRTAPIDFTKLFSSTSTYSGLIGRTQWSDPYASFFGGELDDFEVFDSALSGDQIAQVAGNVPSVTGLVETQVRLTTTAGTAPQLPATLEAQYADGYTRPIPVTWENVDPAAYATPGTVTVHGSAAGTDVSALVSVTPAGSPTPIAHYDFNGTSATSTVADSTDNRLDATLVNPGSATVTTGQDGSNALTLPGGVSGSATAPYVRLPRGVLAGARDLTVSARVRWAGGAAWQRIFDLGTNNTSYLFTTPSNGDVLRSAVTTSGGGGEATNSGSAPLPKDAWHTVTLTLDATSHRLTTYLDGAAVDTSTTNVTAGQLLSASATSAGSLGKSFYADPYFAGAYDDVTIYQSALTAEQVAASVAGPVPTPQATTGPKVSTSIGTAPSMPLTVVTTYSDGYTRNAPVTWAAIDPASYAKRGTFTVAGTAAGLDVTATVTVTRPNEVSVDLADDTGPFMGGAVGTLYGLYGQDLPSNNLIDGIKLRTVATKAQDGPQHPGADALEVLKPLVDSSAGDVYVYMTDIYRGFPYEWPGSTPEAKLADFKTKIATQVDQVASLPEKYRSHVVFVPFNEPEGNMFGTGQWSYNGISWLDDPQYYFRAWDEMYALIKGKLPQARIAGPNTSVLFSQVQGFLKHALAAGTMPDVITWHELSNPASIRSNVAKFRSWEDALYAGTPYAGRHLPINIDEYAFNYHTSVPGQMIQWASALEDAKVDGDIAYWNIDGNLSDSAVQANRGNGQWWLLNAYGQMTGDTVALTPPHPNANYTLQGVATLDESRRRAQAIIGGGSGDSYVSFDHVDPAVFGQSVHVSVKEIRWSGQIGDNAGPQEVAELQVPVTDGSASIQFGEGDLPALDAESAYVVTVTPGAGAAAATVRPSLWTASYEAEDAAHSGTGYTRNGPEGTTSNVSGFYTSGGYDVGGLRTGSDVALDFTVDAPQDGTYDLSVFANSLNTYPAVAEQGPTNVFLTVDGGSEQELYLPLGYKWVVWDHADTTVRLSAGVHTLRLAARSIDGKRGTLGDALIDKIDLSLPNPEAQSVVYQGRDASLDGATVSYGSAEHPGPGAAVLGRNGSATFWVYAPHDATHPLAVDLAGGGTAQLVVNDHQVATLHHSGTEQVFLEGGVNKVTLRGERGSLRVERLRLGEAPSVNRDALVYPAEKATISGSASVASYPLAAGGKAVTGIGGEPGNHNELSFAVNAPVAGTYAVTVRYSNGEQSPASHYNPDPLARHADITVDGRAPQRVWFPHTFHDDNFWDLTFYTDLKKGANVLTFHAEELPDFDGTTYVSQRYPEIDLRSHWAPNVDQLTVTPMVGSSLPAATRHREEVVGGR